MTHVLPLFFHFAVSQQIGAELNAPERTRNYLMSQQKPSFVNWRSRVQSSLSAPQPIKYKQVTKTPQVHVLPCSGIFAFPAFTGRLEKA